MPFNIYPGVDEDYKFPPLIRQGMALYTELIAAFAGKYLEEDYANHEANTNNPHSVTKSQVGLGNVDNTSDANKPLSVAAATALNLKAPLASPAFTGTPTGITKTHVGLSNVDNTSDANKPISSATQTALNLKALKDIATTTTNGLMSSADKVKLNSAVPDAVFNSLMWRDSWGRSQIATPVGPNDVVSKGYVDSKIVVGIGEYVATGNKPNAYATGQDIDAITLVSGGSTSGFPVTPGTGLITVNQAGIYAITVQIRLFNEAGMTTTKSATGRSFIDIIDDAGDTVVRITMPTGESQTSAQHSGMLLASGAKLRVALYQTTGGVAYYRARLWIIKLS